jgi:hypothetical protein
MKPTKQTMNVTRRAAAKETPLVPRRLRGLIPLIDLKASINLFGLYLKAVTHDRSNV